MADIVISEFMDAPAVATLKADFEVHFDPTLVDNRSALLNAITGARALIVRNRTQVDAELIAAAPALQAVGRLGVGLDNIDTTACEERGIAVYPATGANAVAVAEYVLATALALVRGGAYAATDRVVAGDWPRADLMGGELAGRTMGLVGLGGIARRVARLAAAFDMSIIAHDPFLPGDDPAWQGIANAPVAEVLATADVVSLHVPLTDDTRNLVDAAAIATMKPTTVVINTSRGGIVDEAAVITALRDGGLAGAALDVFAAEPIDPTTGRAFAATPNLILTPHIAGITHEANVRVSAVTADNVRAHLTR